MITLTTMLASATFKTITTAAVTTVVTTGVVLKGSELKLAKQLKGLAVAARTDVKAAASKAKAKSQAKTK